MFGFCSSDPSVPIEHLDYKHIEKCTDAEQLQNILQILRSGEEGRFPALEEFTERRLAKVFPESSLLEKVNKERFAKDLSRDEQDEMLSDFAPLDVHDMVMKKCGPTPELPPVRTASNIPTTKIPAEEKVTHTSKKAAPRSYNDWSKLEKELDAGKDVCEVKSTVADPHHADVADSLERSYKETTANYSREETETLAKTEKMKGNEAFRCGDYKEALVYYKRSLRLHPTPAVHNNRAIALIKMEMYKEAWEDCNVVLEMEPGNIKAHLRRGIANEALDRLSEAQADFYQVLDAEPRSKRAMELLAKVTKKLENLPKKGKRLVIEEVNSQRTTAPDAKEKDQITVNNNISQEASILPTDAHAEPSPSDGGQLNVQATSRDLPHNVLSQKNEGNAHYKAGNYEEAFQRYTTALHSLMEDKEGHEQSIAVLFSNRAICHMKIGRCKECVHDCNKSIGFSPTAKAFLRRAMAYDAMEKYGEAYIDYQLALQLDRNMNAAMQASTRLSTVLRREYGSSWRERLPHRDPIKWSSLTPQNRAPVCPTRGSEESTGKEQHTGNIQTEDKHSEKDASAKPIDSKDRIFNDFEKRFNLTKEEGNKKVKEGVYEEAVKCYSTCISMKPDEMACYTNRALCYLKLDQYKEAIMDCTTTLKCQPQNVKALFRRAQAEKRMKNYKQALTDFTAILKIEENNTAAKKAVEECKQLYRAALSEMKSRIETPAKKGKKIKIEEINTEKPRVKLSTKADACPILKHQQQPVTLKKMTGFEFLQAWNSIKSKETSQYASLLKQIDPVKLTEMLSNKLDGDILQLFLRTVHDHFTSSKEVFRQGYLLLKHLCRVARFTTMLCFLGTADKALLKTTFDLLESRAKQNGEKTLKNEIVNLKSVYRV